MFAIQSSKFLLAFGGRLIFMPYDIKNTLAVNLQHLMEKSSDLKSQNALAKRSKVAQTTIGNYLRPDSYTGYPAMDKVDKLARAFGLDAWVLIHPTLGSNCLDERKLEIYDKIRRAFDSQ